MVGWKTTSKVLVTCTAFMAFTAFIELDFGISKRGKGAQEGWRIIKMAPQKIAVPDLNATFKISR